MLAKRVIVATAATGLLLLAGFATVPASAHPTGLARCSKAGKLRFPNPGVATGRVKVESANSENADYVDFKVTLRNRRGRVLGYRWKTVYLPPLSTEIVQWKILFPRRANPAGVRIDHCHWRDS